MTHQNKETSPTRFTEAMVEIVARAICDSHSRIELGREMGDEFWAHIVERWRADPTSWRNEHVQSYFTDARAALTALTDSGSVILPREATDAMLLSGFAEINEIDPDMPGVGRDNGYEVTRNTYRAMRDAALGGK